MFSHHNQSSAMSRRSGQSVVAVLGAFVLLSILCYYSWSLSSENTALKGTIVMSYNKLKDMTTLKASIEKKNLGLSNRMVEMEEARDTEKQNAETEKMEKKKCENKLAKEKDECSVKVASKAELLTRCENDSVRRETLLIRELRDVQLESYDQAQTDVVMAKIKYVKSQLKSTKLDYVSLQNKFSDLEKDKMNLQEKLQKLIEINKKQTKISTIVQSFNGKPTTVTKKNTVPKKKGTLKHKMKPHSKSGQKAHALGKTPQTASNKGSSKKQVKTKVMKTKSKKPVSTKTYTIAPTKPEGKTDNIDSSPSVVNTFRTTESSTNKPVTNSTVHAKAGVIRPTLHSYKVVEDGEFDGEIGDIEGEGKSTKNDEQKEINREGQGTKADDDDNEDGTYEKSADGGKSAKKDSLPHHNDAEESPLHHNSDSLLNSIGRRIALGDKIGTDAPISNEDENNAVVNDANKKHALSQRKTSAGNIDQYDYQIGVNKEKAAGKDEATSQSDNAKGKDQSNQEKKQDSQSKQFPSIYADTTTIKGTAAPETVAPSTGYDMNDAGY
eukprot:gene9708-10694_t